MSGDELHRILERLGDFGSYQKFQHFLHLLCWLTAGVHVMSFVFVFPMLEHRCFVPEIDGPPENSSSSALLLPTYIPVNSSCSMYENGTDSAIVPCSNGYVYSSAYFKSSRVAEWNMVCDREWMRALLQSFLLFGALVGALVSGLLADKYGRKVVVCACGFAQLIFGLFPIFINNYALILITMFGYGLVGAAGAIVPAMALTMEIVGPTRRPLCGILFACVQSLGFILDCVWAWLLPQSVGLLQLIFALHSLLLFGHWWWMDESICWLWATGQREKALKIAKKAATWNGVNLEEFELVTSPNPPPTQTIAGDNTKQYGISDLFKYPAIRQRSLVMMYVWFTSAVIYFGLTYNSVNLSGNPYLAFIINILVELPGNLLVIWLAPKIGNKVVLSSTLLLSGLTCIILPMLPEEIILCTILTMTAKCLATISFNIINSYTAELFPTVVRNTALGLCVMGSRAGAAIVPELNLLGNAAPQAPSISFGTFGVLASLFVLFLMPETMNKTIPQCIEEVEKKAPDER